jgi:hypothetical protein
VRGFQGDFRYVIGQETTSMELLLEKLSKAKTNGDFLGSLSGGKAE